MTSDSTSVVIDEKPFAARPEPRALAPVRAEPAAAIAPLPVFRPRGNSARGI